ncbi:MAG: hypothetical protein JNJ73_06460 [Hyphomonadaceae bacterium]|nr:hypothetical protein [Hyphomonadaceae bacterium]
MTTRVRARSVITAAPRSFSEAAEAAFLPDWAEEIAAADEGEAPFDPAPGEAGLVAVIAGEMRALR